MRMDELGIKVAFCTSEKLYDDQREAIRTHLRLRGGQRLWSTRRWFHRPSMPVGGMHLTAEDIIVEIVDAAGHVLPAGEAGEIVVTLPATGDFPFIRYRTGDVAVMDTASCARQAAACPCSRRSRAAQPISSSPATAR